mmetsp:Transcript_10208/g.20593  ORF Transcript_10208/g.20593 Transcript_10208/m.20593 type:complete len:380 (-) Transcript_10208:1264-2403(-)
MAEDPVMHCLVTDNRTNKKDKTEDSQTKLQDRSLPCVLHALALKIRNSDNPSQPTTYRDHSVGRSLHRRRVPESGCTEGWSTFRHSRTSMEPVASRHPLRYFPWGQGAAVLGGLVAVWAWVFVSLVLFIVFEIGYRLTVPSQLILDIPMGYYQPKSASHMETRLVLPPTFCRAQNYLLDMDIDLRLTMPESPINLEHPVVGISAQTEHADCSSETSDSQKIRLPLANVSAAMVYKSPATKFASSVWLWPLYLLGFQQERQKLHIMLAKDYILHNKDRCLSPVVGIVLKVTPPTTQISSTSIILYLRRRPTISVILSRFRGRFLLAAVILWSNVVLAVFCTMAILFLASQKALDFARIHRNNPYNSELRFPRISSFARNQ